MASRFWVGSTGTWDTSTTTHWSASTGGASGASAPTAADDVFVDGSSGSPTITLSGSVPCRSLTTTGATCVFTWANTATNHILIGDASGGAMTLSATTNFFTGIGGVSDAVQFVSTSNNGGLGWPITTNGVTCASMTFNGAGGAWQLQGNLTISTSGSGALTHSAGTLDTNGKSISAWTMQSSGSSVRTLILGASAISLSSTSTVWSVSNSNLTLSAASSAITLSGATSTTRSFGGGNQTYGTLTYTDPTSTGALSITGANTFTALTVSARNLILPSATTTTVTNLNVNGTLGSPTYLTASTSGSAATISSASNQTCSYLVVKDSTATGGGTFKAVNSQNVSGNTGWVFGYARSAVPSTTPRSPSNYLFLPGTSSNFAATPNAASLLITGDIDMRAYCRMANWKTPLSGSFIGKWGTSPDRGYDFEITTAGLLRITWSPDGTGASTTFSASTVATGLQPGQASWVRATLQVDNGSSQHVANFYLSNDGITWNQLGTTVTTAGVVSIFASTHQMEVAHVTDNVNAWRGDMYYAEVRNGINGTIVANPDFRAATNNGFTDSVGNVWTVNSAAPAPAQLVGRQ